MSIDYRCYIGPYFECETKAVAKKETVSNVCVNKGCGLYNKIQKNANFCRLCGSKLGDMEVEFFEQEVDQNSLIDAFNGTLHPALGDDWHFKLKEKNLHWYFCNKKNSCHYWYDSKSSEQYEITPEIIEDSTNQFLEICENEYKILQEKYGQDKVRVRWGVVNFVW
jgi:hypothetical protein